MKNKAALTMLFLFVFGAGFSGAAADENQRPTYYYDPPYEYYYPPAPARYPAYMPREFGIKPEIQIIAGPQLVPQPQFAPSQQIPAPGQRMEEPVPAGFIPYQEAQQRYPGEGGAPLPPQLSETPNRPEADFADGFIPYEYAREKYSAPR